MAFADTANSIIRRNAALRSNSTKKYRKLRELYIGVGNNNNVNSTEYRSSKQIEEGRRRAIVYYKKRNLRITIQVLIIGCIVLALVIWGAWQLLF